MTGASASIEVDVMAVSLKPLPVHGPLVWEGLRDGFVAEKHAVIRVVIRTPHIRRTVANQTKALLS